MKNKFRNLLTGLLIFSIAFTFVCTSTATTVNDEKAIVLKNLGLLQSTNNNFNLDQVPNRVQAAVMLVRLLGQESNAIKQNLKHPFTDVPAWASPYVGYMYQNNLSKGVSKTKYGTNDPVNAQQYLTFVLRALGYSDVGGKDFKTAYSLQFAWDCGLIDESTYNSLKTKTFTRDDMVGISYNALNTVVNKSTKRLINILVENGAVKKEVADANNINTSKDFYGIENKGIINGIIPIESVVIDSKGPYQNMGKSFSFTIDRSNLPSEVSGFSRMDMEFMYGKIDEDNINATFTKAYNGWQLSNETYNNEIVSFDMGLGTGNYLLIILYDNNKKPLGYEIVHFYGFNDDSLHYQDVTERYECVDLGTLGNAKIYNIKILRDNSVAVIPEIDYSILPLFKKPLKIGMGCDKVKDKNDCINQKDFYERNMGASLIYENEITKRTQETDWGNVLIVYLADADENIFGYSIMIKK